MAPLEPIALADILAARERIEGTARRTPLLPLPLAPGAARVLVKLENLQPIGSFKIRGAANAMAIAGPAALAGGVYTASAGNMAQGVAWCARELGVPCQVIVPDSAPANKIAAIERLGGRVIKVPFDQWWQAMVDHGYPGIEGVFVHPFADARVMAGNATIACELIEDEPAIDTVLVPWGGGGLACGIASALRLLRPSIRVFAVEVDVAAPLSESFARGEPTAITPTRTFIDGIGGRGVSPEIWPLAQELIGGVLRVTVAQVAAAVKLLAEQMRVVAEGAGAAPVAAALLGVPDANCIACIVSGGNIDAAKLATILNGEIP
jgi:threonine dehydratase